MELSTFIFETERLRMRPMREEDEGLFCGLYTDVETMRFIDEPLTWVQAAICFKDVLGRMRKQPIQCIFLTIEHKATGTAVGMCGVPSFDECAQQLEVGIILRPDAGSKGCAREALAALNDVIFAGSCAIEIWVECSAQHLLVERMVSSIGFNLSDEKQPRGALSKRTWSVKRPLVHGGVIGTKLGDKSVSTP